MARNSLALHSGDPRVIEAVQSFKEHGTVRGAARALGLSESTVRRRVEAAATPPAPGKKVTTRPAKAVESFSDEYRDDGNERVIESRSLGRIRTIEDALAHAEVDTTIWRPHNPMVNSWEVATFDKKTGEPIIAPLWQVKVPLRRLIPEDISAALDLFHKRAEKFAPRYKFPTRKRKASPNLLELHLPDAHFGKLAWAPETGEDYDLNIAAATYHNAIEDLLARAHGFQFDRVLLPFGSDYCHVDNLRLETEKGTPQDFDGRYHKMVAVAVEVFRDTIDRLVVELGVDVDIPLVEGNHDPTVAYHIARELAAWYRHTDRVHVDHSPRSRKYRQYGQCLIGYAHGNEEKLASLPALMATEVPDLWSSTRFREWHIGHGHRRKLMQFVPVQTHDGVVVRMFPSLGGTDRWHARRGYISNRAADAMVWSPDEGLVAAFTVNARAA